MSLGPSFACGADIVKTAANPCRPMACEALVLTETTARRGAEIERPSDVRVPPRPATVAGGSVRRGRGRPALIDGTEDFATQAELPQRR
jgi:hypothetical protein